MKVFVRAGTMTDDNPEVLAFYDDDTDIADDAHGTGVQVISNLSREALISLDINDDTGMSNPMPNLRPNWREFVRQTWTRDQKLRGLHEAIMLILDNGTDRSKWSAAVRDRLTEIDRRIKE